MDEFSTVWMNLGEDDRENLSHKFRRFQTPNTEVSTVITLKHIASEFY